MDYEFKLSIVYPPFGVKLGQVLNDLSFLYLQMTYILV